MTNLEHYKREISDRWMGYVKHRGQERYNEYLGLAIIDVYIEDLKRLGLDEPACVISVTSFYLLKFCGQTHKYQRYAHTRVGPYWVRGSKERMR